jgi:hypothetical protein
LDETPYVLLDARYERVREAGQVMDCAVLVAVGVTASGHRRVLGVSVALSEAEVHWRKEHPKLAAWAEENLTEGFAVFAPDFASLDHASTLKHALEPAVAARARKLGPVLAVKVRHVPARKAALVQLHNVIDLRPTGTAFGYLAQPLVQQPLQSIRLKSLNVAAKAALALAQY